LVNIAHISTEYDTEAESRVLEPHLLSKFTSDKNRRYAAATILK